MKYYDDFEMFSDDDLKEIYNKIEKICQKEKFTGIVYFISDNSRFIKIGKTTKLNILERITSLQVGNPNKLIMIGFKPIKENQLNGTESIERMFHNQLKTCRKNGEWFEISDYDLNKLIESEGVRLTINYIDYEFKSSSEHTGTIRLRTELPYDISIDFRTEGCVDGGHGKNMFTFKFNSGCMAEIIPFCDLKNPFCYSHKPKHTECIDCQNKLNEGINYEGFHLIINGQCEFQSLYACLEALLVKMGKVKGLKIPNQKAPEERWY